MSAAATLSVIASIFGFLPFCFPMGLIGIVLGIIARGRIALSSGRLRGIPTANAGIGLGVISLVAWVLLISHRAARL